MPLYLAERWKVHGSGMRVRVVRTQDIVGEKKNWQFAYKGKGNDRLGGLHNTLEIAPNEATF